MDHAVLKKAFPFIFDATDLEIAGSAPKTTS